MTKQIFVLHQKFFGAVFRNLAGQTWRNLFASFNHNLASLRVDQINAWLNPAKKKVDPDPVKETAKTPPTKTKPPSLSARIAGDIGLLCQTQWPTPLVGAAALAGEYPQVAELVKKATKKPLTDVPRHIVKLGGDDQFNLSVLLDSKGAAKKVVELTVFQRKTWKTSIEEATGYPWSILVLTEKDWSMKELEKYKSK